MARVLHGVVRALYETKLEGIDDAKDDAKRDTKDDKGNATRKVKPRRTIDIDKRSCSSELRASSSRRGRQAANSRTPPMQQAMAEATTTPVATPSPTELAAADVVNRYSAWAAAAGVIPVPVVDVLAVGGVQLKMLRELSRIYDVEFSENIGKSVIGVLVGALVPAGAAPAAAMGFASALKFVPVIGSAIASLSMPAFSAAATYAVGKVFIRHFASGGTLLDFNPQEYRDFLRQQARSKSKAEKDAVTAAPATDAPAKDSAAKGGTASSSPASPRSPSKPAN